MLYTETTNIKYDINKHQYYITDEYLQDNYGFSLGDELSFDNDNDIDKFIKRASNVIYTFIHKANPDTANIKDYMIASDIGLRDTVAESIGEFLYSIAQYGYDNSDVDIIRNSFRLLLQFSSSYIVEALTVYHFQL